MSTYVGDDLVAGGVFCPNLLDFKWTDHKLNDISWLRSDTFSWQSGAVYQAAYQHLADDISSKTLQSETIGATTIQFYLADDGHKICPTSEESNVVAIYNATGVAWYYIIDTVNERFKLPRINPDLEELAYQISAFGDGNYLRFMSSDGSNKGSYINSRTENLGNKTGWLRTYNSGGSLVNLDNMKLSDVKGQSGIKVEKDTIFSGKKYLYFYVGNFTQTALENTAGVSTEILNDLNEHKVIAFQAPTAQNNYTWYRRYADGWVEQGGFVAATSCTGNSTTQVGEPTFAIPLRDQNYEFQFTFVRIGSYWSWVECAGYKIDNTKVHLELYNNNSNNWTGAAGNGVYWSVRGMAA